MSNITNEDTNVKTIINLGSREEIERDIKNTPWNGEDRKYLILDKLLHDAEKALAVVAVRLDIQGDNDYETTPEVSDRIELLKSYFECEDAYKEYVSRGVNILLDTVFKESPGNPFPYYFTVTAINTESNKGLLHNKVMELSEKYKNEDEIFSTHIYDESTGRLHSLHKLLFNGNDESIHNNYFELCGVQ